jgi:hypothetical protein
VTQVQVSLSTLRISEILYFVFPTVIAEVLPINTLAAKGHPEIKIYARINYQRRVNAVIIPDSEV